MILLYNSKLNNEEAARREQEFYQKGYMDACDDFVRGKVKVEMVSTIDGEINWKWVGDK